ncbi:SpoIIE family protein phosphatase [Blastococcus goldschmidtiae]|uniref:SpoIIE family protein phosphatase n=1 Tax=Blastococcus goldschmidtiae TaxID=3075546 RepID=A0ABU2K519_9ACTN|nr:SpoIIE family protein phosphatase [Blastococcus sp. DSM 46792]MDT0275278.1 SpoIIE family protein phosphatase [Blastococcus sp. DSM 46792]
MSTDQGSLSTPPDALGPEGAAALLAGMETAPAAIYCVGGAGRTIWANASARRLGADLDRLPPVDGRPLAGVVDAVTGTGRADTLRGPLGQDGPSVTVVVRAMSFAGERGAMAVIEHDDPDAVPWPLPAAHAVEAAQSSLLPPFLPMLPDLALAGSYHQATSVRAAGGDWYDAVPLGDGKVALVVGDAVGHGVAAAGAMSRLRGAMRSTALRDPSPPAVLADLDAFAAPMDDVEGASVFYGVLDSATGALSYTTAGHPAPLVVRRDGSASFLPVTPRPPLGSMPGAETPVHGYELAQGATLVLFSNGALAGGGSDYAVALDRLVAASREVLGRPGAGDPGTASGLAVEIAELVRPPHDWPDDVAVLVAHRREIALEPLQLDLVAVPASLPGVRRRLSAWLTELGMGENDRVGVMAAVGEACANAAEHAYRGTEPGPMSVRAEVDADGVLSVTIHDDGTWRAPDRDPGDRGRGLLIMRQLVDSVSLDDRNGTTVTLSMRLRRSPEPEPSSAAGADGATVVVDRDGPRPVVRATGAVDESCAGQLRIRLLEASHGGTVQVELDLHEVTLFSSAAVRVVLAMARIARDEGWRLIVHAAESGVTRSVLEVSGLGGLVDLR